VGVTAVVRRQLGRWAVRRPHALVVGAPGGTAARLAVERELVAAGGVVSWNPADADLLITAGPLGEELRAAADRVWAQVPGPAVRVEVTDPAAAGERLAAAVVELAGLTVARPAAEHDAGQPAQGGGMDPGMEHGMEHGTQHGMEHGTQHGMEHGTQHGMDPGMDMPGGLRVADRAADRDGLRLDVLHVPLGPVLPAWPAGLLVDVEMQGDLIQSARGRLLAAGTPSPPYWSAPAADARRSGARRAAAHLDSLGRLLTVAGWDDAAGQAQTVRDELLSRGDGGATSDAVARLRRRLSGSRALRLATDGLGVLSAADAARWDVTGPAARAVPRGGDATARWQTWLDEAALALADPGSIAAEGPRGVGPGCSVALLRAATALMAGLDVAAARIVMASLDPDPDELAQVAQHEQQLPARGATP